MHDYEIPYPNHDIKKELNILKRYKGKKIVFQDHPGYFLVEGFEKHGDEVYAYGVNREGHYDGARPRNPKRKTKGYYLANSAYETKDFFKLYRKTKKK